MIKITWGISGVFAGLKKLERNGTAAQFTAVTMRQCLYDAVYEWVTRSSSPSMHDRFGPGAYNARGFTHRKPLYEARQAKVLSDGIQPYAKPRRSDFLRLALALGKAKTNPRQIIRAAQDLLSDQQPLRKAAFIPGSGFNIKTSGSQTLRVTLTIPAARKMNRGGSNTKIYRDELLDFNLAGGIDRKWIWKRAGELMQERFWKVLQQTPMTKLAG